MGLPAHVRAAAARLPSPAITIRAPNSPKTCPQAHPPNPLPSSVIIIDAYNVLHAAANVQPDLAGLTLPDLARLIEASRHQNGSILVCDGTGTRTGIDDRFMHPDAPVRVVFAGPGKDADSAIARMVIEEERKGRAGSVTVVSSDKGVLASAIGPFGAKAKRMTSEQFVRIIMDDAARGGGGSGGANNFAPDPARGSLDPDAARRWMKEFGYDAPAPDSTPPKPSPSSLPAPAPPTAPSPNKSAPQQPPSTPSTPAPPAEDWPEGINPDDLDMGKWLKG